jgi:hypothetical protein
MSVLYFELAATSPTTSQNFGLLEPGHPHLFYGLGLLTTKVAEDIHA